MKRLLFVFGLLVSVTCPSFSAQAQRLGPTKIDIPNGADVDAITLDQNDGGQLAVNISSGGVSLWNQTIAQIDQLLPVTTGQLIICSNCVRSAICVSSGTLSKGSWVIAVATGTTTGTTYSGFAHCQ